MADYRSAEAAEYRRLYKTARWQRIREAQLKAEPICRMCIGRGLVNDGSLRMTGKPRHDPRRRFLVCDHIRPHRGDPELFWRGPFQTLCPDHHDVTKQQEETTGFSRAVDAGGWPTDPRHRANRGNGG